MKTVFFVIVLMIPLSAVANVIVCELKSRDCLSLYPRIGEAANTAAALVSAAIAKFNGDLNP